MKAVVNETVFGARINNELAGLIPPQPQFIKHKCSDQHGKGTWSTVLRIKQSPSTYC